MALTVSQVNYKDNSSWRSLIDMIYPKGSIFLGYNLMNKNDTTSNNHPDKLFGGSWLPIKNKMLRSGWGSTAGGNDRHQHVISSISGQCIANIGASNDTLTNISYEAIGPASGAVPGAWVDDNGNDFGKHRYLPDDEEIFYPPAQVRSYTAYATDWTNNAVTMNHSTKIYGFTGNSA